MLPVAQCSTCDKTVCVCLGVCVCVCCVTTDRFWCIILSVSLQVWKIFRPCTVFRVRDLNITSSSGRSMWIGSWTHIYNKHTHNHRYMIIYRERAYYKITLHIYLWQTNEDNPTTFPAKVKG